MQARFTDGGLSHDVTWLVEEYGIVPESDYVVVEDYGRGLVPLVVPTTLIRHLARRHGQEILLTSSYLSPHPKELMLRNHA